LEWGASCIAIFLIALGAVMKAESLREGTRTLQTTLTPAPAIFQEIIVS
jgi:hypothetical protein